MPHGGSLSLSENRSRYSLPALIRRCTGKRGVPQALVRRDVVHVLAELRLVRESHLAAVTGFLRREITVNSGLELRTGAGGVRLGSNPADSQQSQHPLVHGLRS